MNNLKQTVKSQAHTAWNNRGKICFGAATLLGLSVVAVQNNTFHRFLRENDMLVKWDDFLEKVPKK